MPLPTFIIGGPPKAGTTALWALLAAHPEVGMSRIKEPVFFTRTANEPQPGIRKIGPPRADTYGRGIDWYASLFAGQEACLARGDASPHYIGAVDGPELMDRHVPGIRVVFVLREPVARTYSHYWEYWKRGYAMPPFSTIVNTDSELRYLLYLSRYRQHLERYRTALGPERVLVLLYDDLRSDPEGTYGAICRFIGVDDTFRPNFGEEYNAHAEPSSRLMHRLLLNTKRVRWDFLPDAIRRPANRLRSTIERLNLRKKAYPPLDPGIAARLGEMLAADTAYVEQLIRPLPSWHEARDGARSKPLAPASG